MCLPVGTGIRAAFNQACEAHVAVATIALEASAPETVADLAVRGLGVAILSESTVTDHRDRLDVIALDDIGTPAVLGLVWSSSSNPALAELVLHCHRVFEPGSAAS